MDNGLQKILKEGSQWKVEVCQQDLVLPGLTGGQPLGQRGGSSRFL